MGIYYGVFKVDNTQILLGCSKYTLEVYKRRICIELYMKKVSKWRLLYSHTKNAKWNGALDFEALNDLQQKKVVNYDSGYRVTRTYYVIIPK